MAQVKYSLPYFARKTIYESLVKSHLNFSNIIFGACKQSYLNTLQSSQNKIVRNLASKKYNVHADPFYQDLGLVKLYDLIKINRIILVKKYKQGLVPQSVEPLFCYKTDTGERRIREDEGNFATLDTSNYSIGLFPMNEVCKTWNNLPIGLKNIPQINLLKKHLAEYFINKYDTICTKVNCYPCKQNN